MNVTSTNTGFNVNPGTNGSALRNSNSSPNTRTSNANLQEEENLMEGIKEPSVGVVVDNEPAVNNDDAFIDTIVNGSSGQENTEYVIPKEISEFQYDTVTQEFIANVMANSNQSTYDSQQGGMSVTVALCLAPVAAGVVVGGVFAAIIGYAIIRLLVAVVNIAIRKMDTIGRPGPSSNDFFSKMSQPFKSLSIFTGKSGGSLFSRKKRTIKDVIATLITSAYLHHGTITKIDTNQDIKTLAHSMKSIFNTQPTVQQTISLAIGGNKGILKRVKKGGALEALKIMVELFKKLSGQFGGDDDGQGQTEPFREDCKNIADTLSVVLTTLDTDTTELTEHYKEVLKTALPTSRWTRIPCIDIYDFYKPELETRMGILQLNLRDLSNNVTLNSVNQDQTKLLGDTSTIINNITIIQKIANKQGSMCFPRTWLRTYGNRIRKTILQFEKLESTFTEYKTQQQKQLTGGKGKPKKHTLSKTQGKNKVVMRNGKRQYNVYTVDGKKCIKSNKQYVPLSSIRGQYKRV
jgi:hypothetical protein